MTEAADNLKASLAASVATNRAAMLRTDEDRVLLTSMLREEMQLAVTAGIRDALTPEQAEQFAVVFMDAIQKQWTDRVDRASGKVARKLVVRLLMFVMFGSIVYAIGGWSGLATFGKWVFEVVAK